MIRKTFAIFTAGLLVFAGCKPEPSVAPSDSDQKSAVTMDDVKRDALTSLETTSQYSQHNKEKLMKSLQDQVATMDANIEKLKTRGASLASSAKVQWNEKMSELDVKREAVKTRMVEVENSTAQAWGDVEQGAQTAWKELKSAFQKASSEFETK